MTNLHRRTSRLRKSRRQDAYVFSVGKEPRHKTIGRGDSGRASILR